MSQNLSDQEQVILEALKVYRQPVPINFMEGHLEDEDFEPSDADSVVNSLLQKGLIVKNVQGLISLK